MTLQEALADYTAKRSARILGPHMAYAVVNASNDNPLRRSPLPTQARGPSLSQAARHQFCTATVPAPCERDVDQRGHLARPSRPDKNVHTGPLQRAGVEQAGGVELTRSSQLSRRPVSSPFRASESDAGAAQ